MRTPTCGFSSSTWDRKRARERENSCGDVHIATSSALLMMLLFLLIQDITNHSASFLRYYSSTGGFALLYFSFSPSSLPATSPLCGLMFICILRYSSPFFFSVSVSHCFSCFYCYYIERSRRRRKKKRRARNDIHHHQSTPFAALAELLLAKNFPLFLSISVASTFLVDSHHRTLFHS